MTLLAKELMQKKVRSQFLDPNFDIFTSLISPPCPSYTAFTKWRIQGHVKNQGILYYNEMRLVRWS